MNNDVGDSKAKKIGFSQAHHFDREGFSGDIYVNNELNQGFTALRVNVHGKHPRKQILEGNKRVYYVVEGTGTFTINSRSHSAQSGDLYLIPAGSEYEYQGTMTLFEFNVSPDNTFGDVKL